MILIKTHAHIVFLFIFNIFLIAINAKDTQNDVTTSPTPTTNLQRSIGENFVSETEGVTKRDLKIADISSKNAGGVAAKSYDPPPEFYRGPGSTGHYTTTIATPYYNSYYKPSNGFISRPIAFPDTYSSNNNNNNNYNKYNGAGGGVYDNSDAHLANSYNSWQHLKGKVGTLLSKRKGALQDRISVGHYATSEDTGSSPSGGYAYESSHSYGGKKQHLNYLPTNSQFSSNVASTAHTGGYYGDSTAAEGIPFDVYGGKNPYSGSDGNDYATYSYSDNIHEPAAHKSRPDISQKALLAKSFLIPLASAAVLGIAAALVSNPLLLQLGTVSGVPAGTSILGKRKRRDLTTISTPNDKSTHLSLAYVEKNNKNSTQLPYRAHHHHHQHQLRQHNRHRHFVRT